MNQLIALILSVTIGLSNLYLGISFIAHYAVHKCDIQHSVLYAITSLVNFILNLV